MQAIALITGASRGIGAATALTLAQAGYAVAVNYRDNSLAADEVVRQIRAQGGNAITVKADVAVEAEVLAMFAKVDAKLGTLTALVNNAGVVDVASRVDAMSTARLQRMLATNVLGSMVCAREAVLRMSTRHGGSGGAIVNLSSVAATLGSPGQYVDYAASKGAIDSFTVGLAREVAAEGIRVNAVRPGIIDTDIHASGGQPDRAQRLAPQVPLQRPRDCQCHCLAAQRRGQLRHGCDSGRERRALAIAPARKPRQGASGRPNKRAPFSQATLRATAGGKSPSQLRYSCICAS